MNVVVSGHTFVQRENWARWERFAELYPQSSVTLLVPSEWETDRYGEIQRFHVERYIDKNFQVIPLPQMSIWGRKIYRSFDMALRKIAPDIFHITEERYGYWAYQALLYRRAWVPGSVTVGNSSKNIEYDLKRKRHVLKERIFMQEMDAIVAVNSTAVGILRDHGYSKPILQQQINGADERIWFPSESGKVRNGNQFMGLTIGYVGALSPQKGVSDLAEALIGLDFTDCTLAIVGDGPMRQELTTAFTHAGKISKLRFFGLLPRRDIPPVMRAFDVLALPSRSMPGLVERFGLVLIEAMLSGVAVIGSDSGGIPEVIGDAGLVFPEGDVDALAGCIRRLKDNPVFRKELAERGRERALKLYSVTAMAHQSYEFFSELLANKPDASRRSSNRRA